MESDLKSPEIRMPQRDGIQSSIHENWSSHGAKEGERLHKNASPTDTHERKELDPGADNGTDQQSYLVPKPE